jgi:stalled ribosome rescue protein Dom34
MFPQFEIPFFLLTFFFLFFLPGLLKKGDGVKRRRRRRDRRKNEDRKEKLFFFFLFLFLFLMAKGPFHLMQSRLGLLLLLLSST